MSQKFIPNGHMEFAAKAQGFAQTLLKEPDRFGIERAEAEALDAAVQKYRKALFVWRSPGGRSDYAHETMKIARAAAEEIMRRLGHLVRLNKKLDSATKLLLGVRARTARPKMTSCPQEPPRLEFFRALHERGASPMHELRFTSWDYKRARPEGAVRLELFVDLIAPDEPVPTHPGANLGGRPWYLRSYTRSPIMIAPPMPRVPMRILYWGRWAGAGSGPGNVGPFSATAAGWIEGGTHGYLPGGLALQLGQGAASQPKLIETNVPPQPVEREEQYRVAVLEVHYQSFHANAVSTPILPAPEGSTDEPRQLEGPNGAKEAA